MPIYEFYCPECNTVFSFFSAAVDTAAAPACPKCSRPKLGRRPSRFAMLKPGRSDESELDGDDPFAGVDEERMEKAMEALGAEFEGMDENAEPDPRQMSHLLRRFSEVTGLEPGPKLRDMLDRLERGEDPESLEAEMGGEGGDGDEDDLSEFFALKKRMLGARARRPKVDETLHFL